MVDSYGKNLSRFSSGIITGKSAFDGEEILINE
jgi:hypothetical protein